MVGYFIGIKDCSLCTYEGLKASCIQQHNPMLHRLCINIKLVIRNIRYMHFCKCIYILPGGSHQICSRSVLGKE